MLNTARCWCGTLQLGSKLMVFGGWNKHNIDSIEEIKINKAKAKFKVINIENQSLLKQCDFFIFKHEKSYLILGGENKKVLSYEPKTETLVETKVSS